MMALLLVTPVRSQGAGIIGDSFQISGTYDGFGFGPVGATATAGSDVPVSLGFPTLVLVWVDGDSFEVTVEDPGDTFSLELTLSDLQFQGGDISGASFNYADSIYETFLASPVNPSGSPRPSDPVVSFTPDSVTVVYGSDWTGQLANDWPTLRFDVTTVPEPGLFGLTLLGFAGLGWRRRRAMP